MYFSSAVAAQQHLARTWAFPPGSAEFSEATGYSR